jgi:hypothetical protein
VYRGGRPLNELLGSAPGDRGRIRQDSNLAIHSRSF